MIEDTPRMLLIDGHGLVYRGYYALPDTLTAPDGVPTNAIVGFTNMLLKCVKDINPNYIGIFFDPKGPTRRHELYKEYKDGRKPTPDKLKVQIPLIIEICTAMGFPVFVRDNIEADDYIVSTAKAASESGIQVTILTADKDLFQIISKDIQIMRPIKGVSKFKIYDKFYFCDEFGFTPEKMSDYLALVGDSADNIIGVKGIGEKGAKDLIAQFSGLDEIYANLDSIPKARRTKLELGKEMAYISKSLIIPIETDSVPLDELNKRNVDFSLLKEITQRLGLKRLYDNLKESKKPNGPVKKIKETIEANQTKESFCSSIFLNNVVPEEIELTEMLKKHKLALAECVKDGVKALVLADGNGKISYVRYNNNEELNYYTEWTKNVAAILYGYKKMLEKDSFPLPKLERIEDVEIVHYVLHPDRAGVGIEETIKTKMPQGAELANSLFKLWNAFNSEIEEHHPKIKKIIAEIDLPLCPVLADLHKNGILVDVKKLNQLKFDLENEIKIIEDSIAEVSPEKINLNSPKQVATLLFEKLKLPPIKKTATGFSTDMTVLEELSRLPEPYSYVPTKLIKYREKSKIYSGFVEPFLKLAEEGDSKIHSIFDHLSTGTGRLSSKDPNVQNLPQFGECAMKFRRCFVPDDGNIFVSADYSQIELRVLAHLSNEEKLLNSFSENKDIHLETASWIFSMLQEKITDEQRRFAKVVNFGLLYGMGSYGLAQRLGIGRPEASKIVERYFEALPKVKTYLNESIKISKEKSYTESIFNRIRPLDEVSTIGGRDKNSLNMVAINTPIQSSASDIAKLALIRFKKLTDTEFKGVKIILQVHDSIVCECKEEDADSVEKRLLEVMENISVLSIPLKAVPKRGHSLAEV
ncbi:MAG: DNA polymerase I [Synergistaceae bacterium]|nr:DNA polymerase I [Synergistaceae bacterium]